jgi:hypothetical protein
VSFFALFVCICVLNYCHRVATQLQLNISYIVSYIISHIVSYLIVWYHIIYHIIYNISYITYIISYRIISYHILYHIIPYNIPCKLSFTDHINIRHKICLGKREPLNIFMFNKDFGRVKALRKYQKENLLSCHLHTYIKPHKLCRL